MGFQTVIQIDQDKYWTPHPENLAMEQGQVRGINSENGDRDEFIPLPDNLFFDAGLKFRVHSPYEPASIDDLGSYIPTGQSCFVAIQMIDRSYYEVPWSRCERDKEIAILKGERRTDIRQALKTDLKNQLLDNRTGFTFFSKYTRLGCIHECIRNMMVDICGGCVPHLHILDHKLETTPECSGLKSIKCMYDYAFEYKYIQSQCYEQGTSILKNGTEVDPICYDKSNYYLRTEYCKSTERCPLPCHTDDYKTQISYATFPSKAAATMWSNYMVSNIKKKKKDRKNFCAAGDDKNIKRPKKAKNKIKIKNTFSPQYLSENLLSLNVYFHADSYIKMQQNIKFDLFQLFSGVGAQMGLWLGISVATIMSAVQKESVSTVRKVKRVSQSFDFGGLKGWSVDRLKVVMDRRSDSVFK